MNNYSELKRLAEAASVESQGVAWAYEPHGDTGEYGVGVLVNEHGNYVEGRQGSCEMSVVVPVAPEVSSEVFASFIAAANPCVVLALIAEFERLNDEYDKAWRHDLNDKNNLQVLASEVVLLSKDAARYRFGVDNNHWTDAQVDYAMSNKE